MFVVEFPGTGTSTSESTAGSVRLRGMSGLRLLSRPRIRSSRGRAGVLVGFGRTWSCLVRSEVRLCDPCARVRPCVRNVALPGCLCVV